MTRCQARLPIGQKSPLAIVYDALNREWPGRAEKSQCGQTVGVTSEQDGYGHEWHWCSLPGHREDVELQMHASEKATFDHEDQMRALYSHGPAGETDPGYRDEMIAAGRGSMLR